MRIAFLSALYPPATRGGGELSTHYIALGLKQLGHDVTVICEQGENDQYEIDGIPVVRLPLRVSGKPLREQADSQKIAQALRGKLATLPKFDIIHAHDFRMALALSELNLRNAVVTNRDYAQICGSTNYLGADGGPCPGCTWAAVWRNHRVAEAAFPRNVFRAWQFAHNMPYRKAAYRQLRHQIFISQAQQRIIAIENDLSAVEQSVIYNPVPPQYIEQSLTAHSGNTILYVGTVEWYKGVGLLLEAFQTIAPQFPEFKLKIVGEGADKKKYQEQVAMAGLADRVEFTGRIPWDQLMGIYNEANMVVAPHIWAEPFGRTVVEAMARGRVVVAANHGGPAEIIQDGTTGLLFQPGSAETLKFKLQQAIQLSAAQHTLIGRNANNWVSEHLSLEKISQQHLGYYQEIVLKKTATLS